MKANQILHGKRIMIMIGFVIISALSGYAQLATQSMMVNFLNFSITQDRKSISYDVYVQDIDPMNQCGIAGYTIRAKSSIDVLGESAKSIKLTDCNPVLGAGGVTITPDQSNWLIKFASTEMVYTWENCQIVSSIYPGTKLATVNIANADGTSFDISKSINMQYSSGIINKSMLYLFLEGTNTPSVDAVTALPISQFSGLGVDSSGENHEYSQTNISETNVDLLLSENSTSEGFYINVNEKAEKLKIFDINGKLVLTKSIIGKSYISVKGLNSGVYLVAVNNKTSKLIKK